ncbi:extracellular solute-binding protein [Iocasia frigidifontis]|uniref:Extracellular solute-binding protein n=1 Tax=Iocasia fonsfrigidae TaxID=2682810 RepID=A0A8A7KJA4_9FIRM|nr:extracellular solute-binding protein [Iocasia fonsfrigidae]
MYKMKRLLTICLCFMMVVLLAACGNQTNETETNSPEEIEFWYSLGGKSGKIIEGMVEDFNKSQDEIVVKATYQGDYYANHAKVLSALASGTQPDVTMIEIASIGTFAENGALEDLGPYADGKSGLDLNEFIPGLMGNSYWKDTLYAIPFNRSTPLLYVNKDMLSNANLDPAGPKTWDELREYARKLTKNGEVYGFSTPIDIWFYEALVFENGGKILTDDGTKPAFNSQKGIEPVVFWKDMIEEGVMRMPPGEKYNAWDVAVQDFINQKVAMIFTSTGSLNNLISQARFEVGTAFLPAKKEYGVPTGGTNLVILSKSSADEKKAAWEFIKYMTDKDQTINWSKGTGYMPVKVSAVNSEEMKKLYEEKPQFKVAIDQLEYAKPRPMVPGYKELQEIIMTEIQRAVIDDNVSVQEALDNAAKKAEKLLK